MICTIPKIWSQNFKISSENLPPKLPELYPLKVFFIPDLASWVQGVFINWRLVAGWILGSFSCGAGGGGDDGWIFKPKWFVSRFLEGEVELNSSQLYICPKDALQRYSQSRRLLSYRPFPAERKNVYGELPYRMVSRGRSVWQQAVRRLCE